MTYKLFSLPSQAVAASLLILFSGVAHGEGSRSLYPASYPASGSRANLDLQPGQHYMNRVLRRGFNYVYAEAGEYIVLGSSNIANGGDIDLYWPQDFGVPGDETLPATPDFSCSGGPGNVGDLGAHYYGSGVGQIADRDEELAGPNSADNSITVTDGFEPCAYEVPVTGIYGVQFGGATSGASNPTGSVATVSSSQNSVAAWDIVVRADATSTTDVNGRVYTYAFLGYTAGNSRPVYSTLYYVTSDGYRYQQDMRGLDPNGYALYANTFGFLDNSEPLYRTLRGNNAQVSNLPLGVAAQPAEFPIFFSDIGPGAAAEAEAELVLGALGIPLVPPSPQIADVTFTGALGTGQTSTGVGGTFEFTTTDTVSYEIVISRDGVDYDPANPLNRMLTGIAYTGLHQVEWDGLDNNQEPFPASATPYDYRAYGRNGEVHFPIIDAENNNTALSPSEPGGGPTITRLNGTLPGDRTVFFDDRGYVTSSGETVGTLNGDLCDAAVPAAASPDVNLEGVDSATEYRAWQNGANRNSDCASDAGWGDAKGVNLWTYFLTPEVSQQLVILDTTVDVATQVSAPALAEPGDTVQGTFSFGNNGASSAAGVTYTMSLTSGLSGVSFDNLPVGVSASYNSATGVVTLSGLPAALAASERYSGMTFSYTAPATGSVTANTQITTTDTDDLPANNAASATTSVGQVDLSAQVTGWPTQMSPGEVITGSVLFSNLGAQNATDVTYSLSVGDPGSAPASLTFTSVPPGVTPSYNPATGVVTLTGMPETLPAGQLRSLSFETVAPNTMGDTLIVRTAIDLSAVGLSDAVPANNSDDATATVVLLDPAVSITGVASDVEIGATVSGTVTFSNSGNISADGLSYTLQIGDPGDLPGGVLFPGLPHGVDAIYNSSTGVVSLSGLPTSLSAGESIDLAFSYTAPMDASQVIPVTATIATTGSDHDTSNNSAAVSTALYAAELSASVTGVPATVTAGDPVVGSVTFANTGDTDASGVVYQLAFPAGLSGFALNNLPVGVGFSYNSATGLADLVGISAVLGMGDVLTFDFSYLSPSTDGLVLPVAASITSSTSELDMTNNAANASTTTTPALSAAPPLPSSIEGHVFHDNNGNGVQDAGELGIPGVTVALSGTESASVVVGADGRFYFPSLAAGTYTLTQTHPAGWTDGSDTAGAAGGDTSVSDVISNIVLAAGVDATGYRFAEGLEPTLTVTATPVCINDVPWVDYQVENLGAWAAASAPTVTIEWLAAGSTVVETLNAQSVSGRVLWPGAAVDGSGNGVAWPGWQFTGGAWVQVPDNRRPTLTFQASINPTGTAVVNYPPATPACVAGPRAARASNPKAVPVMPPAAMAVLLLLVVAVARRRLVRS